MNQLIKSIMIIIGCSMVSMITGYELFWQYQISGFPVFFSIQAGMFVSALMMVVLSGIWVKPNIVKVVK